MYRRKVDEKKKMQPSKEDCTVFGKAVRVAGFNAPQCQAAARLRFDFWRLGS
jgi:hypothetical protein